MPNLSIRAIPPDAVAAINKMAAAAGQSQQVFLRGLIQAALTEGDYAITLPSVGKRGESKLDAEGRRARGRNARAARTAKQKEKNNDNQSNSDRR